ncbi:MAG: RNA-splicing ligase RtcB [Candidatus Latescibacterota bacterium]|nr:MAG: RNA-splicing ligase RtcB [Candidatus Latescibacterota bacterium]RKY71957.1 MAG: RNA-splicing ligase RtcB [Candidatus Latescibacterota bacterium]
MELKGLERVNDYEWVIPASGDMRVPVRIFASQQLIDGMDEKVREQATNVACLPGIQKASIAMPDAHWGYGFPIGGVAAFDAQESGVISVGGVGFDVNCGVRTLKTNLFLEDVKPKLKELVDTLFQTVPAGVGSRGEISLSGKQIEHVLTEGAQWVVEQGYGTSEDIEFTEDNGKAEEADPANVSQTALKREKKQVGTLGSGNHYLEIQYVAEVYNSRVAEQFGLLEQQVVVTIHCGSRALGHQVGTDYLKNLAEASRKYEIPIRERELVCAPLDSKEGRRYFSAMNCAVNYAFANRQVITHLVRSGFEKVLPQAQLTMLYDVGHNTCKVERHQIDGKLKEVYVHRKGATRAFGPQREQLPQSYQGVGQPVIIGGTMGTESYILVGTEYGEEKAFASVCHGAGRQMSRRKAVKKWRGEQIVRELNKKGIYIQAHSLSGVAEEAPMAYKDVTAVIEAIHNANLAAKVVKLKPIGCIKG